MLYLTGMLMKISVDLTKHSVKDVLLNKEPWLQKASSTILLYLDAFFGVVMWVGGFNVLYLIPGGTYWYSLTSIFFIASIILMLIKAFHCSGGVPLALGMDEFENVFNPSNYFNTKFECNHCFKVILDTFFTYSVVHTLVICCWWSMWELENRFIFYPCEITVKDIKAWDSVIFSYFLVFLVVHFNNSVQSMKEEDGKLSKVAANNLMAFLAFLASLNFWRGIWSLMDFYFFPSMNLWENLLLSHVTGFLGTLLTGTSLTLTQRSGRDSATTEFIDFSYRSKSGGWGGRRSQYEDLDQQSTEQVEGLVMEPA